ncbi:condensation domain-containing protein [Actinophytocola oryzae]|uniref:Condensation domain-containing protein n=1 Tax=Actinophytocola oryzae TaxID=502181 RepID=A0A4R7VKF5_9PSEU|nr:condensation domain-containing protein [Actinophytocola oryzae]TDV49727.1 condensation domain-containing protein [Actinophytocola oryzae]
MAGRTTTDRITIPFSGPGAGTAPLTWGQKTILRDMEETGWTHNSSGAHQLPHGTTVEAVAASLRALVGRYPALRLRLGTDADGQACQVVSGAGEIDLEVVNLADDTEPADVGKYVDDLCYTWMVTPFDPYREWSLRMAVIRHRDVSLYRVLTVGHLVADGAAVLRLVADLRTGRSTRDEPPSVGPLELGRSEQTPESRRISDRAVRYWETRLRSIPPQTFGARQTPRLGKRYRHGRFDSPAAHLAVLAIAERTRTDTSRVLLAVLATAIGRATGVPRLTTKVVVSNRFRPGLADAVATLSQDSVLSVELDGTVDDVIARACQASTAAWLHAYYDPDQLEDLRTRLDRERGCPARVTCRINDRRAARPNAGVVRSAGVTTERIHARAAETSLVWEGDLDESCDQLFVAIEDRPGTVYLQGIFDLACFTEEQAERLLRGVEEVAVAAAFDPVTPTGVG